MIRFWSIAALAALLGLPLTAQTLDPGTELTLPPPWKDSVPLGSLADGRYRLEATTLEGEPIEVVAERRTTSAAWSAQATNRSIRGSLDPWIDLSAASGDQWRVRPARPENVTVILRLRKAAFSELKDSLKQELTSGSAVTAPLKKRLELPAGTGGPSLTAAVGPAGNLWVGWLTDGGWGAQVWDAVRGRPLGRPLQADQAPWSAVVLSGPGPLATLTGTSGDTARAWTGSDWSVENAASGDLTTPWGRFRTVEAPVRVYKATASGWQDLALPRDDASDRVLLGSTDDGLAVLLASSRDAHRALYTWNPSRGWIAMPPPPAAGPPWPDLWSVTSGAGSLYQVDGDDASLWLRQFDGSEWRPALDLRVLAPHGARAALLLGPSAWSKTGSLVLAGDAVSVYDLP
jgi:hypothetical protein